MHVKEYVHLLHNNYYSSIIFLTSRCVSGSVEHRKQFYMHTCKQAIIVNYSREIEVEAFYQKHALYCPLIHSSYRMCSID